MPNRKPLEVEVIAHVLGSLDHCSHCQVFIDGIGVGDQIHRADLESYPADWRQEWQQLSDLVYNLTERFANRLVIKITDAKSPQALWMALRSGIRKYPTFIIANEKYHGTNEEHVASMIERYLDSNT